MVQPALSGTVPVTGTIVANLFSRLGLYNTVCLFSAVVTDKKVALTPAIDEFSRPPDG